MVSRHRFSTLPGLRAVALIACATLALLLAACAQDEADSDEPLVLDLDDKTRVTIEAEFSTTTIPRAGLQQIWVRQSSGWDPCPAILTTEFPPDICWIRVLIDETLVAVLLPEPDGTLGPYPIPLHFDVFDFELGEHQVWLIQVGRLEVRHSDGASLQIEPPAEEPSA